MAVEFLEDISYITQELVTYLITKNSYMLKHH